MSGRFSHQPVEVHLQIKSRAFSSSGVLFAWGLTLKARSSIVYREAQLNPKSLKLLLGFKILFLSPLSPVFVWMQLPLDSTKGPLPGLFLGLARSTTLSKHMGSSLEFHGSWEGSDLKLSRVKLRMCCNSGMSYGGHTSLMSLYKDRRGSSVLIIIAVIILISLFDEFWRLANPGSLENKFPLLFALSLKS